VRAAGKQMPIFNRLAVMFDNIASAINQTANAAGVDSTAMLSPPNPPQQIQVKANNGTVHVSLTDSSQRSRALNYFVEASTSPAFLPQQTHIEHLGPARSKFFSLPGNDDDNNPQPWYFRTYSMQPGSSKRSAHQVLGGAATPTPVTVGGSTQLTPLTMTGAGTTAQAGHGFGISQFSESPKNAPP
jgi:hypothetical protein